MKWNMTRMNYRYLMVLLMIAASCSTSRKTAHERMPRSMNGNQYIKQYKDLAIEEMNRSGIPASITLAQGMLESNYGNSTLAREANNHFGIKCHSGWKGKKIYHDDDRRGECFRRYKNVYQSYKDHSRFLTGTRRYAFLFDYKPTDYKRWARGLKKAGYATSPTYASKLISLIERYELHHFDRRETRNHYAVSSGGAQLGNVDNFQISVKKHTIRTRNRIDYIRVKEGDTFKSLNDELDLLPWELKKYNELNDTSSLQPGQVLYLQPKRKKAEKGFDVHTVKGEETLYSISQRYGVKLEELYDKNHLKEGEKVHKGQKIWLRKEKPGEE